MAEEKTKNTKKPLLANTKYAQMSALVRKYVKSDQIPIEVNIPGGKIIRVYGEELQSGFRGVMKRWFDASKAAIARYHGVVKRRVPTLFYYTAPDGEWTEHFYEMKGRKGVSHSSKYFVIRTHVYLKKD